MSFLSTGLLFVRCVCAIALLSPLPRFTFLGFAGCLLRWGLALRLRPAPTDPSARAFARLAEVSFSRRRSVNAPRRSGGFSLVHRQSRWLPAQPRRLPSRLVV